jgi:hypothetical protein
MVDCGDGREHGCPVELCIARFTRSARDLRAPRGERDYARLTLRDDIGSARHEVAHPLHEVDGSATRTRSTALGVALADLHGARYPICIVPRWSVAGMASCLNTGKKKPVVASSAAARIRGGPVPGNAIVVLRTRAKAGPAIRRLGLPLMAASAPAVAANCAFDVARARRRVA